MEKREFLKRALDANAFTSAHADAAKVNPVIWERKVRDAALKALVVGALGDSVDFTGEGSDYNITIDVAPSAMSTVAETADSSVVAISFAQVQYTPTEYSAAYQLTDKEARRAFFSVADNMAQKLGYSYALGWETALVTMIIANVGDTVLPDGRALITNIVAADALTYEQVNEGVKLIEDNDLIAMDLVVRPSGKRDLLNDTAGRFSDAGKFGSREAILNGKIGRFSGLDVYQSTVIPTVASTVTVAQAFVLGQTKGGEKSFGTAIKAPISIKTQYNALGRYTDIVGTGEFDVKPYRSEGLILLQHAE